jgi:hypothetical protein
MLTFYKTNATRLMAFAALAVLSCGWLWRGAATATDLAAYAGAAAVIIGTAAYKSHADKKLNGNGAAK